MNFNIQRRFWLALAGIFLTANLVAADTNIVPATATATVVPDVVTHDEMASNYLQIQEQIHATQIAIEKAQQAAALQARNNADALAGRLQSLENSVANQRATDADAARKTQQLTLFLAGVFGLAGLGIMLLMVYFQWRAFTQLAEISSQHHVAFTNGNAVHHLAAPGRAAVENSNTQLLDVIHQLEKRINELESGQRLLPEIGTAKPADLFGEVQRFLDAAQPQLALDLLENFLAKHPQHADALTKKAVALDKLGRSDEALVVCDRAIAADGTLAIAHLQKGGMLNRLRRYDEALLCYEEALRAQEKKVKV